MSARAASYVLAGLVGAMLFALAVVAGAALWLWTGGFDAAASSPRSRLAYWPVRVALARQLERGAGAVGTPPKSDGRRLIFGYRQYDADCAACHGAPDQPRALWAKSMNPEPPDLTETDKRWSEKELYWLICHGVKMTGMPAFGVHRTDDEIWDLALFVSALPGMRPETYQQMRATYGPAPKPFDLTANAACVGAK